MSPSVSPDRPSNERRIQDLQTEIDKLDGALDGKTELTGLSQEQRDALKAAKIDKVNAAQGSIRRSLEKIRTQKELRTGTWRDWEAKVIGIESDLARLLEKSVRTLNDPKAAEALNQVVANSNAAVDTYLQALDAFKQEYDASPESSSFQPQSVGKIFQEWRVPGTEEEVEAKAHLAVTLNGGEDRIRQLSAVISLYDGLPKGLRQKYFGTDADANRLQIAGQLANGTFEQSPLGVLLKEHSFGTDQRIAEAREQSIDRVENLTQQLNDLNKRTHTEIVRLCGITKEDVANGTIADIVAWAQNTNGYPEIQARIVRSVQELGKNVQNVKQEIATHTAEVRLIDAALRSFDTTIARQQGKEEATSQLLFLQKIESGIDIPMTQEQILHLRPSQQELLGGRNTDALRTSVRDFNQFAEAHPELDTLDRTDVLQLTHTSRLEKRDAQFALPTGFGPGVDLLTRSTSRSERHLQTFLEDPKRELTALASTGMVGNGRELILVELRRPGSAQKENAIALRDEQGIVRLQDGTVIQNPVELLPTTVNISYTDKRTVYVSPQVQQLLSDEIGRDPTKRVILRNKLDPSLIHAPIATGNFTVLDASQLQITEKSDDGILKLYDADRHLETSVDAERLRKESVEKGGDVLQNIDAHPTIRDVTGRAAGLQENMQNMQLMLQTAMSSEANPGNEFIDQLRNYALPMLQTMEDQTTKEKVFEAKAMLQEELKSIKLGKYVGEGVEREIKDRIDALDSYIKVLSDNRLLHGLRTATELRPSTWESWRSKEGLIMLGAIIAAVIAIGVLSLFTGGAFLLTVPGILASSAVGGLAGLAGEQATREVLYQYHNREGGGAQTGEYRYSDGARLMNYSRGQKIFDKQSGEFVEMSFLKDVASPYAQEFFIGFVTTAAAMGFGGAAGKVLSRFAQNSKFVQGLAKNSTICNSIMKRMSGLADDVAKTPSIRQFAEDTVLQTLDELKEEAQQTVLTEGFNRFDTRLGTLSTFILAAASGFTPLQGNRLSYGGDTNADAVRAWALKQGHTVASVQAGVFDIKLFNGQTLILQPQVIFPQSIETSQETPVALEAPVLPREVMTALESVGSNVDRPKDYPSGVDLHLDSHHALINSLVEKGDLTPELATIAHSFVEHHDLAYSNAELDLSNAEHRSQLLSAFKENALASDSKMTEADASRLAEQTLEFVSRPDNQNNYLIRKVILHGSGSVVPTARRLQEAGMTAQQAQGLAMLFAAHHPGYPISFVDAKLLAGVIPAELRPVLLIDTKEGGDPDALRAKIAERGGELLGISPDEARKIAALGYALDRITPARRMEEFTLHDDGSYSWTGGETSKKYPLIVTNQKSSGDFTVAKIYADTIANVQQEANAAVVTAQKMGVEGLDAIIQTQSSTEIQRTADIQSAALAYAGAIDGFSGHFHSITSDISLLEKAYRNMKPDDANRDACGYLLGTLKSIESNPNAKPFLNAARTLRGIEEGSVTMKEYQGIRDLGKVLKLPIADQEVLARKVLENSDTDVNKVIRMDDTVGTVRTLDQVTETRLTQTTKQELAKNAGLKSVLPLLEAATNDPAPLAAMEWIVSEVQNPIEQTILSELLVDVRGIESAALTDRERAIIFRESMEYLHDYQAAIAAGSFTEANPNAQDVFKLLQDNQRKLAHQTIVDRKFLTGSDHGVLHVIEADMRGAMVMADQLGGVLTPEARVLLHQATIDHDMGYTLNSLDAFDTPETVDQYRAQTKDHPLYSGVRTTDTWAQSLEQHFGPSVRDIYHTAVLDHSDVGKQPLQELAGEIRALDKTDPQYEEKNLSLQGKLVRKILALADCSGTTADIKMMKLFMEPELVGQMSKLKDLDEARQPLKKQLESMGPDTPNAKEVATKKLDTINQIARDIHVQMMDMVKERYTQNGQIIEPGSSYLRALKENFDPTDPGFAVNRDFGSHAASFEGLTLESDRPSLTYGVNDNFPLVKKRLGPKVAVSAFTKAMDDFGLDLGKNPKAKVDNEERASYGITDFCNDLTSVYEGNKTSLIVETPQGKFTFVKTDGARSKELAEGVSRTLRREAAVRNAIEVLENPGKTHDERVLALSDLGRHFDASYTVAGQPAIELIAEARLKLKLAVNPQEQQHAAEEVRQIMHAVKYQGHGVLQQPINPPSVIERKAA